MQEKRKRSAEQPMARMVGHGVDYANMCKRLEAGEDYVIVCEEIGDRAQAYAEKELAKGHNQTASIFLLNASAIYRVGEYGLVNITEEKLRLYRKMVDCFNKGIRLSHRLKSERIELPYKDSKLNGWLLIPNDALKDVLVVLIIAGWTGFKEEMYSAYAIHLIERGMQCV
ncbi:alpha/beta hydrolase [Paenibacillus brasilensis]|uniref:Uncharacterized protein n=1 Tax=Paenibacillus brasilensis TaxID=128574 RepID=A0ABU0L6Z4_9BACL|nr:alpha/beta hydrolase [Paenibacillus brasilensis]MDQ0497040.1 hypothetical protein [Paenibacillus brasilensis]